MNPGEKNIWAAAFANDLACRLSRRPPTRDTDKGVEWEYEQASFAAETAGNAVIAARESLSKTKEGWGSDEVYTLHREMLGE